MFERRRMSNGLSIGMDITKLQFLDVRDHITGCTSGYTCL